MNAPASRTVVVPTYYPGVADLAQATPFTVARDVTTSALDLQMLAVAAYQVSGVVMDISGRAASGATAQLVPIRGMPLGTPLVATAWSDGTFRIVSVPVGTYVVDVALGLERSRLPPVVVESADVSGLRLVVQP